ncbi:uncharacterized protein LOC133929746 [Phragmites australis]|uniref:uncharacterized protein LOC133929746 n=1 Tax=Phragmites australis TaxID=29695 RepID=UPI002D78CCC7|nr:uncharacterized protein LOC133929746 [Phragmites australis]
MESLSSVGTIVRIAQEIAAAVATVSRNRSRCKKLAKRVQGIGDLLQELNGAEAGATTDAATRKLLGRLEEALCRALQLVRSCQDCSCPRSLIAGGRMADRFDEVDGEIDRCLLDLGVANRILIARLERLLLHQNVVHYCDPARTETVTLRIGMPCDDRADHIKRRISMMQGVMDVAAAASNKDQFRVTIRSDAVDIPSLLDQVKEKLNRNVELVSPAATTNASNKSVAVEYHMEKQNYRRYASGDEIKKEKPGPIAAAANMVGMNQAPAPYAYLPFAVALVPIGDASSMHHAPSPYILPYPQGPPAIHPVHAQRQSNPHRVHFNSIKKYDSGGYAKDDMKERVTADSGADSQRDPAPIVSCEEKDGAATGNVTAIGVPVHTVTAGVHELAPPPSYGYGYWPYTHDRSHGDYCHDRVGGPSDAAAYNYNHYSWYQDMFSDENPNACSVI